MTSPVYSFGVDLSKRWLDCFVLPEQSHFRLSHDSAGVSHWCDRARDLIQNGARVLVVVEASGGYERLLHERWTAADVPVAIVNPTRVRPHMRAGLCQRHRSPGQDRSGGCPGAGPLRSNRAAAADPAPRSRTHRGARPVGVSRPDPRRDRRPPPATQSVPALRTRAEQEIARLKEQRDTLARDIAHRISQTPALATLDRQLRSVPGVGALVSAVLLASLPELGQLKAIVSLAGVAPFAQGSGDHKARRTIQGGRPKVRSSLYIAALVGIRCNPVLQAFYDHLTKAGKPGKLALTACMRTLLVILNALVRTHTLWQPDHSLVTST